MSERPVTHEALPLIEALLNGTIDNAGFARLEALLRDDAAARALYRSSVNLHATLPGVVGQSPRLSIQISEVSDQGRPLELHEMPHDQLMGLLAQVEAKGTDLDPMTLPVAAISSEDDRSEQDPGSISRHDMIAAGRYLLGKCLAPRVVSGLAAAAVLLLGMTVWIVTSSNEADPSAQAVKPDQPGEFLPQPQTVATLTAEQNAQWQAASGTALPGVGDALVVGQQLSLTQGYAQITTQRGAIAMLEAPATVQLLSDNALRLQSGKLVGICETDSSKGFLVRTPHMDVVDLGTQFGVDVSSETMTEAHVFEGEVEAVMPAAAGQQLSRLSLSTGQAARASDLENRLVQIEVDSTRFAATHLPRFLPAGTGFGLAMQDIDPNWRVFAVNDQPVSTGGDMTVVYPNHGDPESSQWLLVSKAIQPQDESNRKITCGTSLQVPLTFDQRTSQLIFAFNADLRVEGIRINGSAVDVPENTLNREAPLTEVVIGDLVRPGSNAVELDIYDRDSHSALRAAFEVKPKSIETN